MKKTAAAVATILVCALLLSGCGAVSRVASGIRRFIGLRTTAPVGTPMHVATDSPLDTLTPESTDEVVITVAPADTAAPETATPAETAAETAVPEETAATTDAPQPQITSSNVSGNRQDLTGDELMEFFRQVVFGGNPQSQVVYKWMDPIVVSVTGNYNQQDSEQLTNIFDMLNEYDGFPGITYLEAAGADANVNMEVRFVTESELRAAEPDWSGKSSCYAVYEYDNYEIYHTIIYLVSDWETSQAARNFILTWGVFYTIGFFNDSGMYYDSIFNPYFYDEQLGSSFTSPVAADWYLVSMLYSKAVQPGMTMEQATAALAQ